MPPKKHGLDEELEEIKKSLNFITGELTQVLKNQEQLQKLMNEVRDLKKTVIEKDKKIEHLEKRVDDLEQYSRMNDLIIQGLETKHRTYARTVTADGEGEDASAKELQTLEEQVVKFFESKNMRIQGSFIEACHTLPKKDVTAKQSIIVRFWNRKQKIELLRQAKKLKGTGVFLNEHLTQKNGEIARQARILKKQNKILATWTRNCKIMIRQSEESKVMVIREMKDLDKYR